MCGLPAVVGLAHERDTPVAPARHILARVPRVAVHSRNYIASQAGADAACVKNVTARRSAGHVRGAA